MAKRVQAKPRLGPAAGSRRPAVMTGPPVPLLGWPPDEDRLEAVFERLARIMPEPKTELNFSSPYTLVVAVALSAQATDVAVNKATDKLFAVADTPEKMLELGEEGLVPFIASIGLYRGKARNVIALSRIVLERHGGEVPLNRADLQALPGVGRKTASVVLNELGIEAAIAVDTHVFRVSHRAKAELRGVCDQRPVSVAGRADGPGRGRLGFPRCAGGIDGDGREEAASFHNLAL